MEPKSELSVTEFIKKYIESCGYPYTEWYVGITDNTENRLFTEHKVDKDNGLWVRQQCFNENSARNLEAYFINSMRTKGGGGGGDEKSVYIYAYKITNTTVE